MNERIEKLVRQAEAAYIPRYDMWQMDSETLQKFAELIVSECVEIVEPCKCGCRCEQEVAITNSIIADIKEHFGVEE